MVKSRESRQLEILKTLNKKFPEITLDKEDIEGANRRRLIDILIANKDVNALLSTLETLGLEPGVINTGILDNIHSVSNDTLYEIKGLYFRTRSKVRPEVFMATIAGFLTDGASIDQLTSVMEKTLETECLTEERVAARAAEKENERKEEMENNEQIVYTIDLNDPVAKKTTTELMEEWTEELQEERNAAEELKENVDQEYSNFKDSVNELKDETLNKTQEAFNSLKETREKKEEEKKKEETSSIWLKLGIGAAVGAAIGVGILAYKKYFEE